MTFTEWYKKHKDHDWNEDYALLYGFANEVTDEYEKYCNENNISPVWNG